MLVDVRGNTVSDRGSTPLTSTIGGVNEHPALYVCSTMFVLLLPLSAVR